MSSPAPDAALHLAALVESSEDAIVSKDLDGIVTSWNGAAERVFGYAADEIVGRSITLLIPEERLDEETMVLTRIRRGDRVEHFDTVRRRKDGGLIDISIAVSPIKDASGRIVGASKIARDISDRRRMERDLHAANQRLLGLAGAAASIVGATTVDAVLTTTIEVARDVFDADGYALWRVADDGAWRIARSYGLSKEFEERTITPHQGRPVPRVVPFDEAVTCEDIEQVPMLADVREAHRREGIASMVVFPLSIHGVRQGTLVFYSRQRRSYGELDVHVGTAIANLAATALTNVELLEAQRRAREAADQAHTRAAFLASASAALDASLDYEATLRSVASLVVPVMADWCAVDIVDERGTVQRVATAHADRRRLELADTLQRRYPDDAAMPDGPHDVIRSGQAVFRRRVAAESVERRAQDADHLGLLRDLQLTSYMCVPMIAQGKPFGAITLVTAESGREYTEEDLRFARELATRASLAVENARAYQRANEASRLKDEFLAVLSHELRTPLNAVLGYIRMLRLGRLEPAKAVQAVEVVERNALALKQIVEDVLDVSRIVGGRLRLDIEPVDLAHIVRESCATVAPAAAAKGVHVETVLDGRIPPVSGDADRLQQVVWNLLSNAIKFTPRGGRVEVRLARVNSHVEIVVSDTGRGIPPEFLPYVFERFRQADASFSREHGGLGLGLAIARQLVELHGGSITAASDGPGRGTTMTVALPLMAVHRPHDGPVSREKPVIDRRPPAAEAMPRLDGIRVLAVDDEPDSLELLRAVLEGAGAEVKTASSAPQALECLRRSVPDVLIADIGMPGMDGLALIRAIRQEDGPARAVPAAALTAYARSPDRVASLSSGYQLHLVKPIDPVELAVTVASLASQPRPVGR